MRKNPVSGRRYVALVRAVNVGVHARISMERLKELFESFGCDNVTTFIQSGNVLFSALNGSAQEWSVSLSDRLSLALGGRHEVFVFTLDDLREAYAHVPVEWLRSSQDFHCHLMFLSERPQEDRVKALIDSAGKEYVFAVYGRVLYYGYSLKPGVRRRMIDIEKMLGLVGTSRTVGVVAKLIELLQ